MADPRPAKTPPTWVSYRASGLVWRVAPEGMKEFLSLVEKRRPDGTWDGAEVLKDDRGSKVLAVGDWVIKESSRRKRRTPLRYGLRRSGSRKAFMLARQLIECGISTPTPMAWATARRFGLRVRDFLITRRLAGAESLADRCERNRANPAERKRILETLGRLMGAFHASGFSNRDMKGENILCAAGADTLDPCVVDMDGVRRLGWVPRARARNDLWPIARSMGRLGWTSDEDKSAFLLAYNSSVPPRLRTERFPRF